METQRGPEVNFSGEVPSEAKLRRSIEDADKGNRSLKELIEAVGA